MMRMERLLILLLAVAVALGLFGYGIIVGKYRWFPYSIVVDGVKTLKALKPAPDRGRAGRLVPSAAGEALPRIRFLDGDRLREPVLWYGGRFQFAGLCPEQGCLAVEYAPTGTPDHAYPLRLEALADAAMEFAEFPYELSPDFSFVRDTGPIGAARYPNGDLLVTFHHRNDNAFPYGGGVARIDRQGYPVWFRRDWSHHWPQLMDDGTALVAGYRIGPPNQPARRILDEGGSRDHLNAITLCRSGALYMDTIKFIAADGRMTREINLLERFLQSRFAPVLRHASSSCDPLHLNYIHLLRDDAGGAWGLAPGDLVASLRSLSAFAILDGADFRLKRLVRGGFFMQHSVQHLTGSSFLLFDNQGGDETGGPSRLLRLDLADGRETTLFPNADTPEFLRGLFEKDHGKIDISPDRQRALVALTRAGLAVEVRLADGAALNVFESLHDVSGWEQFRGAAEENAAMFKLMGLDYAP